jgi:hypothetical protein
VQTFRNIQEPETTDIRQLPGYSELTKEAQASVYETYNTTYNNTVGRLGIKIAQGIAFETAKKVVSEGVAFYVGPKRFPNRTSAYDHVTKNGGEVTNTPRPAQQPTAPKPVKEDEVAKGIVGGIKKAATAVINKVVPSRRKAQKAIKRVMGEDEKSIQLANAKDKEPDATQSKDDMDEDYEGFDKLKGKLAHKKGVTNPGALAASIGRKKYGKDKFQNASKTGHKLGESEWGEPEDEKPGPTSESVDPMISAAAGYITKRATSNKLMEQTEKK